MKHIVIIAGAPGSGKSTVAKLLQEKLDGPLFEFGWIPEFRNTGSRVISYVEDESLAFENLVLVAKNYVKHGFQNVIITDLENKRLAEIPKVFSEVNYLIVTLRVLDQEMLKARVLDESRSSGYRDWEEALQINQEILGRPTMTNEAFIDIGRQTPEEIAGQILDLLKDS